MEEIKVAAKPEGKIIAQLGERYSISETEMYDFLKSLVSKNNSNKVVTRQVFLNFCMLAFKYELDPFAKEITLFPTRSGFEVVVLVDGWSKIINRHPEFDGIEFTDHFNDANEMIAITCKIYRKDRRHPIVVTEYMEECRDVSNDYSPWKRWPRRMLRHKAMIQCARVAFNVSGIIDPDEYDRIIMAETAMPPINTIQDVTEPIIDNIISPLLLGNLRQLMSDIGVKEEDFMPIVKELTGVESLEELPESKFNEIESLLLAKQKHKQQGRKKNGSE